MERCRYTQGQVARSVSTIAGHFRCDRDNLGQNPGHRKTPPARCPKSLRFRARVSAFEPAAPEPLREAEGSPGEGSDVFERASPARRLGQLGGTLLRLESRARRLARGERSLLRRRRLVPSAEPLSL